MINENNINIFFSNLGRTCTWKTHGIEKTTLGMNLEYISSIVIGNT